MYQVYLSSEFWLSILVDLEITFHIVRCGDSYYKHSGGSDRRIGSSRPPSNYIQSLRPPWIHEAPFQHFLYEIKIKEKIWMNFTYIKCEICSSVCHLDFRPLSQQCAELNCGLSSMRRIHYTG